jgi:hypothetical protein
MAKKPTNTTTAGVGLKARTGRAIAVALRGPVEAPELIKRFELTLHDARVPATFQPYHEVMDLPWHESQAKVKPIIRAIEKVASRALAALIHELRAQGLTVVGVGIVGSTNRDLSRIGNYHIRAHAAEGVLFRQVLEFAAEANKLSCRSFAEKSLYAQACTELGCTTTKLNNSLTTLGRDAGPPWRTDQRAAATAALMALQQ